MREVRIRFADGGNYIIPLEEVDSFDGAERRIQEEEVYSDGWYEACDNFDNLFSKYNVEGKLESKKFHVSLDFFDKL